MSLFSRRAALKRAVTAFVRDHFVRDHLVGWLCQPRLFGSYVIYRPAIERALTPARLTRLLVIGNAATLL